MHSLLFVSGVLATYTRIVNGQSACTTPNNEPGKCISAYDCKPLLDIANDNNKTPQQLEFLKKSHCGFDGSTPYVCCPNSYCTSADGKPGKCIDIFKCNHLLAMTNPPVTQQNLKFVEKSKCSGNTEYSVCCGPPPASKEVIITKKVTNQGRPTCTSTAFPPDPNSKCCGVDSRVGNKIVGGLATTVDQYPWLGVIEYHRGGSVLLGCGGSLISGNHVLTAAHCLIGDEITKVGPPRIVRLSEYDTTKDGPDCTQVEAGGMDCTENVLRMEVDKTIPHPEYDPSSELRRNDIGLIRLRTMAPFTYFIRPICLPSIDVTLNPPTNFTMYVAGWGAVSLRQSRSDVKLHVSVPFVNLKQCQAAYSVPGLRTQLWNKQMCAGGEKNKDSCKGDSGGPLMYEKGRTWEVIGVVSFGPLICGSENVPGVYTKVFDYKDWILSNIR